MNAHQRRLYRRAYYRRTGGRYGGGCNLLGYSGTTQYPDLMCTDGFMTDMDGDGFDPSVARQPCPDCHPVEHAEWMRELREDNEQEDTP